MTANDIKFRCSSLGYIMTNPKSKSETLSETCKTHLVDLFVSAKYSRREEIDSKFLIKGNAREEDSITLLSQVKKVFFKKNDQRLKNEFIIGEPDIYTGPDIHQAIAVYDTKTSWSANTFFRAKNSPLNPMYKYQGLGYMALTGAKSHTVAYCLVNSTYDAIQDELKRLAYRMNLIDPETNEDYLTKARQIEINHIYDIHAFKIENPWYEPLNKFWTFDIPTKERCFWFTFLRDDAEIQKIYDRIIDCRKWMDEHLFNTVPDRELIESL